MGQREDHVQVTRGEKFLLTRSDPAIPSGGLTLRAMAVPAANGENPITCIMGSSFYWRVRSTWCHVLAAEQDFDGSLTLHKGDILLLPRCGQFLVTGEDIIMQKRQATRHPSLSKK